MKRILTAILCIAIVLCFCACGKTVEKPADTNGNPTIDGIGESVGEAIKDVIDKVEENEDSPNEVPQESTENEGGFDAITDALKEAIEKAIEEVDNTIQKGNGNKNDVSEEDWETIKNKIEELKNAMESVETEVENKTEVEN